MSDYKPGQTVSVNLGRGQTRIVELTEKLGGEGSDRWWCTDHKEKCHPCYNESQFTPIVILTAEQHGELMNQGRFLDHCYAPWEPE